MVNLRERFHQVRFRIARLVLMWTSVVLLLAFLPSAGTAQIFNVLYEFGGGTDGGAPNDLVRDSAGNLYGTTINGGQTIFGTVFKLDPSGKKIVLYNFMGGTDGSEPHGDLVLDAKGNLYGTTEYGGNLGVLCGGGMQGCGIVFKIDPTGHETVLYSFAGGADGAQPLAGLMLDEAGNLYGTTAGGGIGGCNYWAVGCGVVFKLDLAGHETVRYSFAGGTDGGVPVSPLVRDSSGNFYGMTSGVGAGSGGTVFKLDTNGKETILHTFSGVPDGSQPYGTLVRDGAGNLYGTTYGGGIFDSSRCNYNGCGVVFKVTPSGREYVLYSFAGGPGGWGPTAGLARDNQGNLYGTTALGGAGVDCCGVVFELNPKRQETLLHTFTGGADGGSPQTGLILDKAGNLYGTALGGTYNGVAFRITPPNFKIATSPTKATVSSGGSTSSTLTISPVAGFTGTVALTCAVPSGVGLTCGVSPNSVTLNGTNSATANLSVNASPSTPAGTYKIKAKGASGTLQHGTAFTLTVL
jgi:uncharacterized repeat protein (TIGR03803 family)